MTRSDARKTNRGKKGANGDGTLYHRKDGRWEIAYTVDGQRHRFVSKDRSEVHRRLMAGLKAREEGVHQGATRESTGTFLHTWLPGMRPQLRYSTWGYEKYLRIHILPVIGKVPLARLGPQHVLSMQDRMLSAGASPTSAHHAQAVLHRALEDAVRWGSFRGTWRDWSSRPKWPALRCGRYPLSRLLCSSKPQPASASKPSGFLR
jgi:integrase